MELLKESTTSNSCDFVVGMLGKLAASDMVPRRGAVTGYDVLHHTILEVVALPNHEELHDRLMLNHPEVARLHHHVDQYLAGGKNPKP